MADPKRKALNGTANSEWMSGFLSADDLANGFTGVEMRAGDGHDGLGGTAFDDVLHGEAGNDQLHGHAGNDTLLGGAGDDTSHGGEGDDLLEDLEGRNGFYGGNGNDVIRAGAGNDTIAGEGGDDRIDAGAGHNTVWLGEGHDILEAGSGNDTITGDGGNDAIRAGGGDNIVYAGSGHDTVIAGEGRDRVTGDDGNDSIEAGGGNDTVYAGSGNDSIDGGSGDDVITGDSGHDVIHAGSGSDTVYAGDGDDRVIQHAGENIGASDLLDAGSGIDTLVLSTTEAQFLGAAFQQELTRYQAMVANGSSAWQQYRFTSLNLTVNAFEKLELVNHGPSAFGEKAVLQAGAEDTAYRIATADLLRGYRDVDGDRLTVSGLTATHGVLSDNGDGSWTLAPPAHYHGPVGLSYRITDGRGGEVQATQGFLLAAVNDAPLGALGITGDAVVGSVLQADASGISDADGLGVLGYQWQRMDDAGAWVDIQGANGASHLVTVEDAATVLRSLVSYRDGDGTLESVASAATGRVATPSTAPADAKVITFESLALPEGQEAPIADGYEGLNWLQAGVYNPNGVLGYTASSGQMLAFVGEMDGVDRPGYEGAPRSPLVVTRAGGGDFSVFGVDVSSAFSDNLPVTLAAYDDGVLVGTMTFKADTGFADHVNFTAEGQRFTSIDRVEFSADTYFGIDNLAIAFTNEAPVAAGDTARVAEDGVLAIDVLANDHDPDVQALTVAAFGPGELGAGISLVDGRLVYDAGPLDWLKGGQEVVDTVWYRVTDGSAVAEAQLEVTVTGVNDLAAISGTSSGTVREDGGAAQSAAGTLVVTDVDQGEAGFRAVADAALQGSYGRFGFDAATGGWHYTLDNASSQVQALGAGQIVVDRLVVTSLDGTASETITVAIQGTADASRGSFAAAAAGTAKVDVSQGVAGFGGIITSTSQVTNADAAAAPSGGHLLYGMAEFQLPGVGHVSTATLKFDVVQPYADLPLKAFLYAYSGDGVIQAGDISRGVRVGEVNISDGQAGHDARSLIEVDLDEAALNGILAAPGTGWVGFVFRTQDEKDTGSYTISAGSLALDLVF